MSTLRAMLVDPEPEANAAPVHSCEDLIPLTQEEIMWVGGGEAVVNRI